MINCASEYLPVQVFRPFGRGKVNSLVHFYARSRMFSVAVSQTNPLCFGLPNTSVDCVVSTLSNFILHRIVKIRQSPVKNITAKERKESQREEFFEEELW